ncbi:hypothetical protein M011DRAFT_287115 [Sporormia fimetaria CBS 119925]|uniref:Uncharacterized protein n=1 Tax=Sporormia fimetaria CBS 119925 TaxID=1340428 RepID=A0A6A6VIQ6_9PLEO|nr:hypothetical protein M011DRAFT_287115 [Sporormia fimetaria CBS 119925]
MFRPVLATTACGQADLHDKAGPDADSAPSFFCPAPATTQTLNPAVPVASYLGSSTSRAAKKRNFFHPRCLLLRAVDAAVPRRELDAQNKRGISAVRVFSSTQRPGAWPCMQRGRGAVPNASKSHKTEASVAQQPPTVGYPGESMWLRTRPAAFLVPSAYRSRHPLSVTTHRVPSPLPHPTCSRDHRGSPQKCSWNPTKVESWPLFCAKHQLV